MRLLKFSIFVLTTCIYSNIYAYTITIYTEDLPPYQIKKRNGQSTGYSVDLVNAMLKQANIKGTVRMMPWARAYNSVLKNKNSLIISMVRTNEREGLLHWIGEIDKLEYYFYRLSSRNDIQLNSFKHAKKYRIGVGANSFEYEKLTFLGFPYVVSIPTYSQLMSMLKANRYDIFFSADRTFQSMLDNSQSTPDMFEIALHISDINQRMYIAMNKSSDPLLVKRLQMAYQRVIESGEKERLAQLWLN